MIGISRRRRDGPDRFLYARVTLFFLGAGFFFAGVATGHDWAVGVAIAVLLAALLLRLVSARREAGDADEADE